MQDKKRATWPSLSHNLCKQTKLKRRNDKWIKSILPLVKKKYYTFSKEKTEEFIELLQSCLNSILKAESAAQLHAEPYERTVARRGSRNGFRERPYNW